MKKKILTAMMLCGASLMALADGVTTLRVLYLDGTSHEVKMENVDKIALSAGTVGVVTLDGNTQTHRMQDIDKIEFTDIPTAIGSVGDGRGTDIVVRSDGYAFTVSGLTDGQRVSVYTSGGALVSSAVSLDGAARVDASSYPDGVYVIKAGGKSLKMVKR